MTLDGYYVGDPPIWTPTLITLGQLRSCDLDSKAHGLFGHLNGQDERLRIN